MCRSARSNPVREDSDALVGTPGEQDHCTPLGYRRSTTLNDALVDTPKEQDQRETLGYRKSTINALVVHLGSKINARP